MARLPCLLGISSVWRVRVGVLSESAGSPGPEPDALSLPFYTAF
ncbi:hypothetical protein [Deinococcus gobiensis]|nr:hypothetical protein [Deinococcus gobiensis]